MNTNKWLCNIFDVDGKGYVTIGDVAIEIISWIPSILFILLIITVIGMVSAGIQGMVTDKYTSDITEFITITLKGWILPLVAVIFFIVLVYILHKISQIKIAECPLKENENK